MPSYKNTKRIICFIITVIILCITNLPAYAATTIEVKHATDIAVSEDDWWDRGVQYGRILVLNNQPDEKDNVLVATHCELNAGLTDHTPGYPIYRSSDNGKSWETIPHIIPYETADHVGYSNSFAFSKDGKTIYAINNPQRDDNPEKSKIVIAVAEVQETTFTQQNNTTIVIFIVLIIVLLGAITTLVIFLKKKKNKS